MFDKQSIKEKLTIDNIYQVLEEWGGEPLYTSFGIISTSICHNLPGDGKYKLYYYENTKLFKCYTDCDSTFDIFELIIKIQKIQNNIDLTFQQAIKWVIDKFNIFTLSFENNLNSLDQDITWNYLSNKIEEENNIKKLPNKVLLKEYDSKILSRFNYDVLITPWLKEGISNKIIKESNIGYYPGDNQITIPHYDKNNRLIGIRGRSLLKKDIDLYGKYRPLKIGLTLYNHPLGLNLYNLNKSKNNIAKSKIAIIYEGEKSTLLFRTYFGEENDISVACCGSSVSDYQIKLLLELEVQEIVIAFDRQFKEIGDEEFKRLKAKLIKIKNKYSNYVRISFIFDKKMITKYKDSPIDNGKEIFLKLFKERIG